MMPLPQMTNFRTARTDDGILHLVFDMPDRSMNVFTNKAIHEIEAFANWLKQSDVFGVVIYSGKPGTFCVGADLSELATAYDMIMATPKSQRDAKTVQHFSPIGRAFRKLETAGKPVAIALHGLALGGGCELALACHYRVMTDTKETQIGLPESLVGLLPGGGGTQRLPRLIGVEQSFGLLLKGARFGAQEAVESGAAHEVVPAGDEVIAAEAWIRSKPRPLQPWDKPDWKLVSQSKVHAFTDPMREKILKETGGHFPAELAILDCIDRGIPVEMDQGITEEIDVFKNLVQRTEPRNMIAVMFLGRVDYDKVKRKQPLPDNLEAFGAKVKTEMLKKALALEETGRHSLTFAGIGEISLGDPVEAQTIADRDPQWFEAPQGDVENGAMAVIATGALVAAQNGSNFNSAEHNLVDYYCQKTAGFPRYLGGPFTFLARHGKERCSEMAAWG